MHREVPGEIPACRLQLKHSIAGRNSIQGLSWRSSLLNFERCSLWRILSNSSRAMNLLKFIAGISPWLSTFQRSRQSPLGTSAIVRMMPKKWCSLLLYEGMVPHFWLLIDGICNICKKIFWHHHLPVIQGSGFVGAIWLWTCVHVPEDPLLPPQCYASQLHLWCKQ